MVALVFTQRLDGPRPAGPSAPLSLVQSTNVSLLRKTYTDIQLRRRRRRSAAVVPLCVRGSQSVDQSGRVIKRM